MRHRVVEVLDRYDKIASDAGLPFSGLLVYCTVRTFSDQARLFRQSRTMAQIDKKARQLERLGLRELSDLLYDVGPQKGDLGRHVTWAGPGESWHQYGEAVDKVPEEGGKLFWDPSDIRWKFYGSAVRESGLYWAGDWTRFREYPHCQLRERGNPLRVLGRNDVIKALEWYRGT